MSNIKKLYEEKKNPNYLQKMEVEKTKKTEICIKNKNSHKFFIGKLAIIGSSISNALKKLQLKKQYYGFLLFQFLHL